MNNIYMTQESEERLSQVFTNLKKFYVLDVGAFIREVGVDLDVPSNAYFVSTELEKVIITNMQLKKYNGVIYIHDNITGQLVESFRKRLVRTGIAGKLVFIDNAWFPSRTDIHGCFDEVLFYERFRRMKIIDSECCDIGGDDETSDEGEC